MKRNKTKIIYDAQYKCRRCSEFFPPVGEFGLPDSPTYGIDISLGINFEHWFLSYEQVEKYYYELERIGDEPVPRSYLPSQFSMHNCADGQRGLADFVGFINERKLKKHGTGWKL